MTATPLITLEDDAVPIVRIIGARFRRAARHRDFQERIRRARGSFALASTRDPQSVTVTIDGERIHLERGIGRHAKITIQLDFEKLGEPGYSPSVLGVFRHPLFTWRVAQLMDFPTEAWPDAAKRYWDQVEHRPQMPAAIRIICTDSRHELMLGTGEPEVEIEGAKRALEDLFSGSSILVQAVMKGQIKVVGSLKHLAVLSGSTVNYMLDGIGNED